MRPLQYMIIGVVLVAVSCGCGNNATTPDDVIAQRPKAVPSQVVVLKTEIGETSPSRDLTSNQVVISTLVEFQGEARLTEEERAKERKFNLRIVRYRADGSRVTCQQGTASAIRSADNDSSLFKHALKIPEKPGDYRVLVTVGKRVVSETPLIIQNSKG